MPVYDGRVLMQGVVRTPLAGDFIARQCAKLVREELKTEPIPYYRVASKVFNIIIRIICSFVRTLSRYVV